jgi:hypothetical protein
MLDADVSRALRTHTDVAKLVAAVVDAEPHDEADWIEWKTDLDLDTHEGRGSLARQILGMDPVHPWERLEGRIDVGADERLQLATDKAPAAKAVGGRRDIEHHRQGLDDERLLDQAALKGLLSAPLLAANEEIVGHEPLLQRRLAADLLGALLQLDEDGDLRAQDQGIDGLEHEVHRPGGVAAHEVRRFLVHRRQEDDRHMARLLAAPDEPGGLISVQAGHEHVQQYDGKVLPQQVAQGLFAGVGADHGLAQLSQHGLKREQIGPVVVNRQDLGRRVGLGAGLTACLCLAVAEGSRRHRLVRCLQARPQDR